MISNKIVNSKFGPMIVNTNDTGVGAQLESLRAFSEDDLLMIGQIIKILLQQKTPVIFYDVGANIGTHSVVLSRSFGSQIKIRAFEAQRLVYYQLCGNLALNNIKNVTGYHAVVNDGKTKQMLINLPDYDKKFNYGGLELLPDTINSDNQSMDRPNIEIVDCMTIDGFNEHVDFIKLDIEGMEIRALEGARETIEHSRPICFVEVLKSDIVQIRDFFRPIEYFYYEYKDNDWIFVPKESDVELDLLKICM